MNIAVIYKYELSPDTTRVDMPSGAEVLSAAAQGDGICIWALVNPHNSLEDRYFEAYPTGAPFPPDHGAFIATALMHNGLVFHVFEVSAQ